MRVKLTTSQRKQLVRLADGGWHHSVGGTRRTCRWLCSKGYAVQRELQRDHYEYQITPAGRRVMRPGDAVSDEVPKVNTVSHIPPPPLKMWNNNGLMYWFGSYTGHE